MAELGTNWLDEKKRAEHLHARRRYSERFGGGFTHETMQRYVSYVQDNSVAERDGVFLKHKEDQSHDRSVWFMCTPEGRVIKFVYDRKLKVIVTFLHPREWEAKQILETKDKTIRKRRIRRGEVSEKRPLSPSYAYDPLAALARSRQRAQEQELKAKAAREEKARRVELKARAVAEAKERCDAIARADQEALQKWMAENGIEKATPELLRRWYIRRRREEELAKWREKCRQEVDAERRRQAEESARKFAEWAARNGSGPADERQREQYEEHIRNLAAQLVRVEQEEAERRG